MQLLEGVDRTLYLALPPQILPLPIIVLGPHDALIPIGAPTKCEVEAEDDAHRDGEYVHCVTDGRGCLRPLLARHKRACGWQAYIGRGQRGG